MTEVLASMQTSYMVLDPAPASSAPPGSVFNDSSSGGTLTTRTTGGSITPIGPATATDVFIKQKQNKSGVTIPMGKRISLIPGSGGIKLADNDDPTALRSIGLSIEEIAVDALGNVLLDGPNAPAAVTGLGYSPGDIIYLSNTPGSLTNTSSGLNPEVNMIMQVGIADCPAGGASPTATDLIMITEVISTPG